MWGINIDLQQGPIVYLGLNLDAFALGAEALQVHIILSGRPSLIIVGHSPLRASHMNTPREALPCYLAY